MKKINIISIILLCLSCVLFITSVVLLLNVNLFSLNHSVDKDINNNGLINDKNNVVENNKDEYTSKEENKNDNLNSSDNSNKPDANLDITINNTDDSDKIINNETNNIVAYFKNQETSIFKDVDQDDRTIREEAKDSFVNIVDFIFYDKEIKGYTFKELTNSMKLEIIKVALSIDSKIDQYFPDYKDVMKDNYNNIKGKLALKYLEFTVSLCERVGDDTCNQAKEDFDIMKEKFNFTWQLLKELASNGSSKVKDFYENWR